MAYPAILDDVKIAAKLAECRGNITACAEYFGVSRTAIQKRVKESESLQSVLHDARESMIDRAEGRLQEAIEDREAWAVCFFLKTQAKHRGYVERQEITGEDGAPVASITEVVVRSRLEASEMMRLTAPADPDMMDAEVVSATPAVTGEETPGDG